MGSMSMLMRSPGSDSGSPATPGLNQAPPPTPFNSELQGLVVPSKPAMSIESMRAGAHHSALQSPDIGRQDKGSSGPVQGQDILRHEYFKDKSEGPTPATLVLGDISNAFSHSKIIGAAARTVVGAPLVAVRAAAGAIEGTGLAIALICNPTSISSVLVGVASVAGCLVGWGVWGIGAGTGYMADVCLHNARRIFGDTQTSWRESLPEKGYPFKAPSRYM